MPELPDLVVYVDRIKALVVGQRLERIRIQTPFVLRSVSPAPDAFVGRTLTDATRLGKRIVLVFSDDLFVLVHLMIAGRLHWREPGSLFGGRKALAALDFERGSLLLTEASSKHRASLHLLEGCGGLHPFRREGVDVFSTTNVVFAEALRRRNRTLKRALTDPDIVDGVGNAYSDEILHRARLSPFRPTGTMTDSEIGVLLEAARAVLGEWIQRLGREAPDGFPEHVTAFRPEMAVHGKHGKPCPVCGSPIQRIRYADNEANYCPHCQTEGRVMADRGLSRLLREDWPRTLQELEDRRTPRA